MSGTRDNTYTVVDGTSSGNLPLRARLYNYYTAMGCQIRRGFVLDAFSTDTFVIVAFPLASGIGVFLFAFSADAASALFAVRVQQRAPIHTFPTEYSQEQLTTDTDPALEELRVKWPKQQKFVSAWHPCEGNICCERVSAQANV